MALARTEDLAQLRAEILGIVKDIHKQHSEGIKEAFGVIRSILERHQELVGFVSGMDERLDALASSTREAFKKIEEAMRDDDETEDHETDDGAAGEDPSAAEGVEGDGSEKVDNPDAHADPDKDESGGRADAPRDGA